jgi:hypothetical protein
MTTLDRKAAFFHVTDSHRWLAASGCAWNLVGANGAQKGRFDADLPNVDVMARDCLLLHARSLIKFYRNRGKTEDILLSDFAIPAIQPEVDASLREYERPIEVHLLHLTDWRDVNYRSTHAPKGGKTDKPDWNQKASLIAEELIACLRYASEQTGRWQQPFKALYEATANRYREKSSDWPKCLGEWSKVEEYLTGLGL